MEFPQPDEHNMLDGRRNSRERRSSKPQTIFSRIQNIGEGFARKAASATELLADRELRRKAQTLIGKRAGDRIKGIQSGAGQVGSRIAEGPRQIQAILVRMQARMEEQRLQASLQAERDSPVDVQVGALLCEDAPQELRSRMWMALLADATLCGNLLDEKALEEELSLAAGSQRSMRSTSFTSADGASTRSQGSMARATSSTPAHGIGRAESQDGSVTANSVSVQDNVSEAGHSTAAASQAGEQHGGRQRPYGQYGRPGTAHSEAGSTDAASMATLRGSEAVLGDVAEALGKDAPEGAEQVNGVHDRDADKPHTAAPPKSIPGDHKDSEHTATEASPSPRLQASDRVPSTLDKQIAQDRRAAKLGNPAGLPRVVTAHAATPNQGAPAVPPATHGMAQAQVVVANAQERPEATSLQLVEAPSLGDRDMGHLPVARQENTPERELTDPGHMTPSSSPRHMEEATSGLEQWEMVVGAARLYDWSGSSRLRSPRASLQRGLSGDSQAADTLRTRIMAAVMNVPWPISTEYGEESRYNTLLQISIGQEEVDEVITRDIHRTFPEHPQFGFAQGQQALFRVLKAYSLHDLEVSYCQGMAFVAGVILMYLPEEPAFSVLTRLMGPGGPDLRTLFLPGLEGLKQLLRSFEWLMERLMPRAKAHLEEYTALPVLYASQWFLTCFSCPFPAKFACRVIDVLLQEQRPHVLLRVALAVVAECEADILQLHDFEDIITFLKVEPVKWSPARMRRVLNNAILTGNVGDDMISCAEQALGEGFEGSLSRRTSAAPDPATAAAAVAAARARQSEVAQRLSSLPSFAEEPAAGQTSGSGVREAGEARDAQESEGLLARTSVKHTPNASNVMDPDYMAMMLAMDTLWASEDGDVQHSSNHAADMVS